MAIDMYHVNNFSNGYMEALQFELGCFYLFHTDNVSDSYTQLGNCDAFITNLLELNGEGKLQIYPNPTASILNIKLPENMLGDYNYKVVDLQGKLVSSGIINSELSTIEVNAYTTGKYILILQNSETTIRGHFIIRH